MSRPVGYVLPGVDPEVDRMIDQILEDPKGYFDRAEAEELEDVQAETARRRQAFEADQLAHGAAPALETEQAGPAERFVALLRKLRESRQDQP